MTKSTNKSSAKKAVKRAAAKKSTSSKLTRDGSKTAKVLALLRRPNGAVSMQALAAAAGVKLKIDDRSSPYTYRA